jgi:hypothetical protein
LGGVRRCVLPDEQNPDPPSSLPQHGPFKFSECLAQQKAFFHNGAFTRLRDAIDHHLHALESAHRYNPIRAGVDHDLTIRRGPIEPVLGRLDPLLANPPLLTIPARNPATNG